MPDDLTQAIRDNQSELAAQETVIDAKLRTSTPCAAAIRVTANASGADDHRRRPLTLRNPRGETRHPVPHRPRGLSA